MVGIVGTRNCDPRMSRFATDLAFDLATRGFVIVSGGALGIDTAAHRGALEAGGDTVAVLGTGFDNLYPEENVELFKEISLNGAVISEVPDDTPPSPWVFPRRNRLVAALSSALVVVQAPVRSGAMITARLAKEMGVPVGAVPSCPSDRLGAGANRLLKGGAAIVERVRDVVDLVDKDCFMGQLNLPERGKRVIETADDVPKGLSPDELEVWFKLSFDPIHIDDIASGTKLAPQVVSGALLKLELSGLIDDLGGKRFTRSR